MFSPEINPYNTDWYNKITSETPPPTSKIQKKTDDVATKALKENIESSAPDKPGFIATTFSKIKESIKRTITKIKSGVASIFSFFKQTPKEQTFTEQEINKEVIKGTYKSEFEALYNPESKGISKTSVFEKDRLRASDHHFKVVYNGNMAFELLPTSHLSKEQRQENYEKETKQIDDYFDQIYSNDEKDPQASKNRNDVQALKFFVKTFMNQNLSLVDQNLLTTQMNTKLDYLEKEGITLKFDDDAGLDYTWTIQEAKNSISLLVEGTATLAYTHDMKNEKPIKNPQKELQHFKNKFIIEIQKENIQENGFITDFNLHQINTLNNVHFETQQIISKDSLFNTYKDMGNTDVFKEDRIRKNDHHFTLVDKSTDTSVIELFPTSRDEKKIAIDYERDRKRLDAYFNGTDKEACKDLVKSLMSQTIGNCNNYLKGTINTVRQANFINNLNSDTDDRHDYTITLLEEDANINLLVEGHSSFQTKNESPEMYDFKTKFKIEIPRNNIIDGQITDFNVIELN